MNLNDPTFVLLVWQQFWQCSLLVLVVYLMCKLIKFNRSHLTFILWLIVLLKFLTPPLWTSSSGLFCWVQQPFHSELRQAPLNQESQSLPRTESIRLMTGGDLRKMPDVETKSSPFTVTIRDVDPNESQVVPMDQGALITKPAVINSAVIKTERFSFGYTLLDVGLIVWALIAAIIVGVMSVRCWRCKRIIRCAGEQLQPELNQLLERLCKELKVKRRVRLLITKSRMGPAVMGLFRPTIILPEVITDARSLKELEPILAHELIHIRRGDLWVGLLQLLASVVWWFNPLVWFSGRCLKFEIEQCCDEEVLAELSCDPGLYAKCLLEVLELKQSLKTVPVVPGVRPVEITSKRLERIMKLGQGCQKRTPWWCWMIFVGLAAVVLPGAAFVVSADDQQTQPNKFNQKEIIKQNKPVKELEETASTPLLSELLTLLPPESIPEKFQRDQSAIRTFPIQFLFEDLTDEADIEVTRPIFLNMILYQLNGQLEKKTLIHGKDKKVLRGTMVINPWVSSSAKDYHMLSRRDDRILMIENTLLVMSEDPRLSQDVSRILQFMKSLTKFSKAETMKRNQSLAMKNSAKEPLKKNAMPLGVQVPEFEEGRGYRLPVPVGRPIGVTTRVGGTTSNSPHVSSYPIKSLIEEAREKVGAQQAEFDLLQKIRLAVSDLGKLSLSKPAKYDPKSKANASALGDSEGIMVINDFLMVMSENPEVHQRVALALETITESMATQVHIEGKIIAVPLKMIESMNVQEPTIKTDDSFSVRRKDVRKMYFKHNGIAFQGKNIERLIPYNSEVAAQSMIYEVLNDQRVKEIEQVIQASTEVKYLSAPSLSMFNGGIAQIAIEHSPTSPTKNTGPDQRHELGKSGISIELRPRFSENASDEKLGRLAYQITFSGRKNLTTQKALDLKTGQEKNVELPLLTKVRYEDSAQIKWGQTLLFGGCSIPDLMSETEVLLVMFKVEKVKPLEEGQVMHGVGVNSNAGVTGQIVIDESNFNNTLLTNTYPVADLVMPLPRKVISSGYDTAARQARFEPLIELIKQNITPEDWEDAQNQGAYRIVPYEKTLSLTIRHTRKGHDQIFKLLEKLRAIQDSLFTINLNLIQTDDLQRSFRVWERSEDPDVRSLLKQLKTKNLKDGIIISVQQAGLFRRIDSTQSPMTSISLVNGQTGEVVVSDTPMRPQKSNSGVKVQLRPELLKDQKLRLSMAINPKDALDALSNLKNITLPKVRNDAFDIKGDFVLFDITDQVVGKDAAFLPYQRFSQIEQKSENQKQVFLLVAPSVSSMSEFVNHRPR
ncbi:M56 family metallopeptidase [uncultured Gimesia sp.]|uniref:M56 family metallopeptidase n=1 Tax=uncultured Gimesia sp. TaxID=1678688 RepID=UPI00260E399A|nr:M56 family metallopeptidase [uncultured Gimesia sp.]